MTGLNSREVTSHACEEEEEVEELPEEEQDSELSPRGSGSGRGQLNNYFSIKFIFCFLNDACVSKSKKEMGVVWWLLHDSDPLIVEHVLQIDGY